MRSVIRRPDQQQVDPDDYDASFFFCDMMRSVMRREDFADGAFASGDSYDSSDQEEVRTPDLFGPPGPGRSTRLFHHFMSKSLQFFRLSCLILHRLVTCLARLICLPTAVWARYGPRCANPWHRIDGEGGEAF